MNYKLYGEGNIIELKVADELTKTCFTIQFDKKDALNIADFIANHFNKEEELTFDSLPFDEEFYLIWKCGDKDVAIKTLLLGEIVIVVKNEYGEILTLDREEINDYKIKFELKED